MARCSVSAALGAGPFLPGGVVFPFFLACVVCSSSPARAQSDAPPQDFSDGTWSGDEGQWEPAAGGDDQSPEAAEGQAADAEGGEQAMGTLAGPTIEEFKQALEPSGNWVSLPTYGMVWQPSGMAANWRPYAQGQWVWTAYGWTWLAEESWGWATYHYGRWVWAGAGWYWAPGRVWGPAWVSWRWGNGVAGWCPLGWGGLAYGSGPSWVFVDAKHFLDPVRHHAVNIDHSHTYYQRARALPVSRPGPRSGPRVAEVARDTRRTITPAPISDTTHPSKATSGRSFNGGPIQVYRPQTRPVRWSTPDQPATRPGWGGIPGKATPHFGGVPVQGILDRHRPSGGQGHEGPHGAPDHGGGPKVHPGTPEAAPHHPPPGPVPAPKEHAKDGGKAKK